MPLHRGRLPSDLQITSVRELTRDDLAAIKEKRNVPAVQRHKDSHHRVARLIATGMRPAEVAAECGYSLARIYILNADPSFQDLVATYRKDVHQAFVNSEEERYKLATDVNLKALRHISDHFDKADEEGELVPIGRALQVFSDTSDRTGLVKKSVQANINFDFAKKLEQAAAQSGRVIEGRVVRATVNRSASAEPSTLPASRTYIEGNLVRKI